MECIKYVHTNYDIIMVSITAFDVISETDKQIIQLPRWRKETCNHIKIALFSRNIWVSFKSPRSSIMPDIMCRTSCKYHLRQETLKITTSNFENDEFNMPISFKPIMA